MNDPENVGTEVISVTFINSVEAADIWILPQTEEILHTSLWGTATFKDLPSGASEVCRVAAGTEKYIIRIIDKDQAYYAVSNLDLSDGCSVKFTTDTDKYDAGIIVLDEKGEAVSRSDNVFQGVL